MSERSAALHVETPGDLEIVMTRVFEAPRLLVYNAWTKPELLKRWFGPRGYWLAECEIDLTVGGRWRYLVRGNDGSEMVLRGVFRDVVEPARLSTTQVFGDDEVDPADESLATTTFEEEDGITIMQTTVVYPSQQIRDEMVAVGMARGFGEGCDKLAELLAIIIRE